MIRLPDPTSKLQHLGVQFKRLGDVVRIKNGRDHKPLGEGVYPVYGSGGIMRYADAYSYDRPSVLIPRKGSLGNLFYVDVPFWTVDTIFYTEIDQDQIEPRFLYHFLSTVGLGEMNQAGGVPSQTQSVLNELKIPVPTLEVQREIVRILDQFTQLEAELEAELEARRLQYAYYRDDLLEFSGWGNVRWLPMAEFGEFIRGRRFTKDDMMAVGVPSIHYGEIYTHYGVSASDTISHVREDLAGSLRYALPGDVVIAGVGETVEDVGKAVAWVGDSQVAIHDDSFAFRSEQDPTYLAYVMQTAAFHEQKKQHVARGKVKRVGGQSLGKIVLPVPPLAEQRRIVGILDRFDTLVNNLSIGLPAELAARRMQYQYYRDRLLSFEEAPA